jgi:hypothetical protein
VPTDEDIALLMGDSDQPANQPTSPTHSTNGERVIPPTSLTTSPTVWGIGEQDLRRPNVGQLVYEDRRTGRVTKYPWNVWQDGKVHVATKGYDFAQSRTQFVTMMHNRARGHDQYLATRLLNENAVEFCFFADKGARDVQRDRWRAEEAAANEKYSNEVPE